jgi:hypothetical protein
MVTLILWMQRWNIEAPGSQALVFAPQSDVFATEQPLEWQPAAYSAQTSEIPLN